MSIANSSDILQAVIDGTPDAIFVKDLAGRYVLVNDAAARFLGRSPGEIVGKKDFELYPEETARQFIEDDRQVMATGLPQAFEGVATGKDGARQAYLVTKGVYRDPDGRILGLFGISHDITELQAANESLAQAREALFRSQKMEVVGQLTGGIAHDFNNILSVILGNVELLRVYMHGKRRRDEQVEEMIDSIIRATLHGKDLTSQLLAFSGRRHLNPKPVDINELVTSTVRMLSRTIGSTIDLETNLTPSSPIALVDAATLEAAILNISLNARDAMPHGGLLRISTLRAEVTEPPAAADRSGDGLVRGDRARGQRLRHAAGRRRARLRAVLHDEVRRGRHRPRPEHGLRLRAPVRRRRHAGVARGSRDDRAVVSPDRETMTTA